MSWQSTLINLMLRWQKRGLKRTNYDQARALLNKVYARSASNTLPSNGVSRPETIAGVPCEWAQLSPEARAAIAEMRGFLKSRIGASTAM